VSVVAVRWAAEQTADGPMRKLVLYALAEHADTSGRCYPSLSTLASETEASVATVKRALAALVDLRLVTRTPRSRGTGATTSTGYTLALPHRKPDNDGEQGAQRATGDQSTPSHTPAHRAPGGSAQGATPRLSVSPHAWRTVSQESEPPVEPTTEPKSGTRTRTRGTTTPAELAATAVRPDAYRLVSAWRTETGVPYRPATIRALAKHADGILRDGGDPAAVQAALDEWNRRPDARPGLLPHLYDDAVKARHNPGRTPAGGLSPRDAKAAGWFALAAEFAAEDPDTTASAAVDAEVLTLDGGRA
jgi:hypothetical protein